MSQWYYAKGGRQLGPVPESELARLAASGGIDPATDLVWREGMDDWKPANEIAELNLSAPDSAAPLNPYAAPMHQGFTSEGIAEIPAVKPASFMLSAIPYTLGIFGFVVAYGWLLYSMIGSAERGSSPESIESNLIVFGVGIGISLVVMLVGYIISLVYLHRAWAMLQPHTPHSTPGRAVGFLFIPFYNLYWTFVAYWRWAQEWNRLVGGSARHPSAPRMNEGLFLTYAIMVIVCGLFGVFGLVPYLVFHLITLKGICNAVNYGARR